jgi:hypothetical protein
MTRTSIRSLPPPLSEGFGAFTIVGLLAAKMPDRSVIDALRHR